MEFGSVIKIQNASSFLLLVVLLGNVYRNTCMKNYMQACSFIALSLRPQYSNSKMHLKNF